jgi:hypothetical protein
MAPHPRLTVTHCHLDFPSICLSNPRGPHSLATLLSLNPFPQAALATLHRPKPLPPLATPLTLHPLVPLSLLATPGTFCHLHLGFPPTLTLRIVGMLKPLRGQCCSASSALCTISMLYAQSTQSHFLLSYSNRYIRHLNNSPKNGRAPQGASPRR